MIFLRKLHKWLSLIIGIQVLIWVVSGMLISYLDQSLVSGRATKSAPPGVIALSEFSIIIPSTELPSASQNKSIKLTSINDTAVYSLNTNGKTTIYSAITGKPYSINKENAEQLASQSYQGDGDLISSELLENGSEEIANFPYLVWQVNFNDNLHTRVYLAHSDGRILAHRNKYWTVVDYLLMLHFMDYFRKNSFNNPQIIAVSFCAFWLALSGIILVVTTFNKRDFRWLKRGFQRSINNR